MHQLPANRPGDRVLRRRRRISLRLRRVLGVPGLFSAGYGDVGSSIYYALGVVALVALGATPIALFIAGMIYVCNALSYAEGSAMLPEAGGQIATTSTDVPISVPIIEVGSCRYSRGTCAHRTRIPRFCRSMCILPRRSMRILPRHIA